MPSWPATFPPGLRNQVSIQAKDLNFIYLQLPLLPGDLIGQMLNLGIFLLELAILNFNLGFQPSFVFLWETR